MDVVRLGGIAAVAGAVVLIASEVLEALGGAFFGVSYVITILAFVLLAAGIWGLHAGQAPRARWLSLAGAAIFTLGVLFNVAADLANVGVPAQERTGLFAALGGPTFSIGSILFGAAVVWAGVYPRLSGVAVIVAYVAVPIVFIAGLPAILAGLANVLLASGFFVMGRQARSGSVAGREATASPAKGS